MMSSTKTSNQLIKKIAPVAAGAFVAAMLMGAFSFPAAFAAVTFDPETGTGFVGKGDVQLVFGWNNQQLQQQAGNVQFRAVTVEDTEWTCKRDAGTQTQERTTTTTTQGVVSKIDRVKNQITGFTLTGYSGTPTTETDGPAVGSCPNFWTEVEGSRTTTIVSSTLQVSKDGTNWFDLQ